MLGFFFSLVLSVVGLHTCRPKNKKACSNHGQCYVNRTISKKYGTCLCHEHYRGEDCSEFSCGEFVKWDYRACNGRGDCISHDECVCGSWSVGFLCGSRTCDGIQENKTGIVCHGNGICDDNDTCLCALDFEGQYCQWRVKGWMFDDRIVVPVSFAVFACVLLMFVGLCALDLFYVLKSPKQKKKRRTSRTITISRSDLSLEDSLFVSESYSSDSTDDLDDLYVEYEKKMPVSFDDSSGDTSGLLSSSISGDEIEEELTSDNPTSSSDSSNV